MPECDPGYAATGKTRFERGKSAGPNWFVWMVDIMFEAMGKTIRDYVEVTKPKHRPKDRKKKPKFKGVVRRPFDSFFKIERGMVVDLGEKKPAGTRPLREAAPRFAVIRDDRSNRTNSVKPLGPITQTAAIATARSMVETERDTDLVVILGRSVGQLDGRVVYQDIAGFQFVEDRLQELTEYRLLSLEN